MNQITYTSLHVIYMSRFRVKIFTSLIFKSVYKLPVILILKSLITSITNASTIKYGPTTKECKKERLTELSYRIPKGTCKISNQTRKTLKKDENTTHMKHFSKHYRMKEETRGQSECTEFQWRNLYRDFTIYHSVKVSNTPKIQCLKGQDVLKH